MFLNATSTFVESSADVSINDNSLRSRKEMYPQLSSAWFKYWVQQLQKINFTSEISTL